MTQVVESVGLRPRRLKEAERALVAMQIDGAVILEYGDQGPDAIVTAVRAVLGSHLRAFRPPMGIITNPVTGEGPHPDAERRNVLADRSVELELHIDGFMQFGTNYPDFVFLLCDEQAPQGGENFAVDGLRLIDALAADPGERDLVDFLWTVELDQSTPTGEPHQAPIASWTPAGRRTVRRHWSQRFLESRPPVADEADLLRQWAQRCRQAALTAPRFLLQPGDLLCLDNYRVFHGRESYEGEGRVLQRIWAWTDMAFGVPANGVGGPR